MPDDSKHNISPPSAYGKDEPAKPTARKISRASKEKPAKKPKARPKKAGKAYTVAGGSGAVGISATAEAALLSALAMGAREEGACRIAGLYYGAYRRAVEIGLSDMDEDKVTKEAEFTRRVMMAQGASESSDLARLRGFMDTDPKVVMWHMEKVHGYDGKDKTSAPAEAMLSPDEMDAIAAATLKALGTTPAK